MVILKSCLMGVLAMVIAVVVSVVALVAILVVKSQQSGQDYAWDPVSMFRHSAIPWLFLTAAFVVGFWWEYRKTVR